MIFMMWYRPPDGYLLLAISDDFVRIDDDHITVNTH